LSTSTVTPLEPELMSVGPDEVVVTFTTVEAAPVVTRIGEHEVVTDGRYHVAHVTGLDPDTEYPLTVEHAPPGRWLPETVRTLARPPGRLVATIATANDVHFGETECGRTGEPATDAIGPILSVAPGEEPYPMVMGMAAVAEMSAIAPDAVVVKGDLTDTGRPEEYAQFLAVYGRFGDRLHHVRGNHDAMRDPVLATCDTPYAVELGSVTLAVLDSTVPGRVGGALAPVQRAWLDDLAATSAAPVMVFAHHPLWDLDARHPVDANYVIARDDSAAVLDIVARRDSIVGFFAGHTHTNRVVRRERARNVPLVEVACAKDYPGAWAEYRCYEGGYTQVMRRMTAPDALAWSERCRFMIQGIYRDLVLGSIRSRCFTQRY
jgi:hypothetical protein